jgi:hypothetical protein
MALDRAALRQQIETARASMRSRGGPSTLRFGVSMEHGFQCTNNRIVCEALCALWNAAPELLAEG